MGTKISNLLSFRLDEWTLSLLLHQISLFLYHQINWEKEKVVCDFANMSKKHSVINLNISGDVTRLPGSETMREQLREIFSTSDIKSRSDGAVLAKVYFVKF